VLRRTDDGADYFENAGKTRQLGLEGSASWQIIPRLKLWVSTAWQDYQFVERRDVNTELSGKQLAGIPHRSLQGGTDLNTPFGLYLRLSFQYTDGMPLNDLNTFIANRYRLLGGRVGYLKAFAKKWEAEAFAGIDNALDETYSLGNDLNATGNRFYNAAPGRNGYAGLRLRYHLPNW
jgi:iron complex outermembrane receptor protein